MSASTCSPCGREFAGVTAFDRHQDVDYSRRPAVVCQDPEALGMVRNERGRWGFPLDAAGRDYFASLAAERATDGTPGPPDGSGPSTASTGPQITDRNEGNGS